MNIVVCTHPSLLHPIAHFGTRAMLWVFHLPIPARQVVFVLGSGFLLIRRLGMEGGEALTRGIASGKEKNTCISVKENASRNCHIKPFLVRSDFVFLPRHPFPCLRNLFDGNNNPFQPSLSHPLFFRKKLLPPFFFSPLNHARPAEKK